MSDQEAQQNRPHLQETTVIADSTASFQEDTPMGRIKKKVRLIRANLFLLVSPGDKQFKDLPKRVRLMLVSFAIPLLFGAIKLFVLAAAPLQWWILASALLGIATFGALYWGLKGLVRKESYMSILPISSWFVVAFTMFLATTFSTPVNRLFLWFFFVASLAVFMILLYIIMLATNVLNVAMFYTIPLSRLGETVSYLASVMSIFLLSHAIATIVMPLWYQQDWLHLSIWIVFYALAITGIVTYLWLYFLQFQKGLVKFILMTAIIVITTFFSLFLILSVPWQIASVTSAIAYMFLGLIIHREQNTLKLPVYLELLAIFAIVLIFLLVV